MDRLADIKAARILGSHAAAVLTRDDDGLRLALLDLRAVRSVWSRRVAESESESALCRVAVAVAPSLPLRAPVPVEVLEDGLVRAGSKEFAQLKEALAGKSRVRVVEALGGVLDLEGRVQGFQTMLCITEDGDFWAVEVNGQRSVEEGEVLEVSDIRVQELRKWLDVAEWSEQGAAHLLKRFLAKAVTRSNGEIPHKKPVESISSVHLRGDVFMAIVLTREDFRLIQIDKSGYSKVRIFQFPWEDDLQWTQGTVRTALSRSRIFIGIMKDDRLLISCFEYEPDLPNLLATSVSTVLLPLDETYRYNDYHIIPLQGPVCAIQTARKYYEVAFSKDEHDAFQGWSTDPNSLAVAAAPPTSHPDLPLTDVSVISLYISPLEGFDNLRDMDSILKLIAADPKSASEKILAEALDLFDKSFPDAKIVQMIKLIPSDRIAAVIIERSDSILDGVRVGDVFRSIRKRERSHRSLFEFSLKFVTLLFNEMEDSAMTVFKKLLDNEEKIFCARHLFDWLIGKTFEGFSLMRMLLLRFRTNFIEKDFSQSVIASLFEKISQFEDIIPSLYNILSSKEEFTENPLSLTFFIGKAFIASFSGLYEFTNHTLDHPAFPSSLSSKIRNDPLTGKSHAPWAANVKLIQFLANDFVDEMTKKLLLMDSKSVDDESKETAIVILVPVVASLMHLASFILEKKAKREFELNVVDRFRLILSHLSIKEERSRKMLYRLFRTMNIPEGVLEVELLNDSSGMAVNQLLNDFSYQPEHMDHVLIQLIKYCITHQHHDLLWDNSGALYGYLKNLALSNREKFIDICGHNNAWWLKIVLIGPLATQNFDIEIPTDSENLDERPFLEHMARLIDAVSEHIEVNKSAER